jgi:signal transduction histidine kinase
MPETYFASAPRADSATLQTDIDLISNHPIIDALLHSASGLLAILNEQRQIISVNDAFLKTLGIIDPLELVSLRPGQAVQCIHANESPNGCGTTKFCASCGAAIAMVACLDKTIPIEKTCALTSKRNGKIVETALAVRAHPLSIAGRRYILLFLQDISKEQFLLSLERTFFHDINNILSGLLGNCQVYSLMNDDTPEIQNITNLVKRLCQEIAVQRTLSSFGEAGFKPIRQAISSEQILLEIKEVFAHHPASQDKNIIMKNNAPAISINTDMALLMRVICNMITNALEATEANGEIQFWIDPKEGGLAIKVWNKTAIPDTIKLRIFQRHFSTKDGPGRGLGTYSMKTFGEQYLGGIVNFTSTEDDGTVFCLTL